MYLLAVVVARLAPADKGLLDEASVNPLTNLGLVPTVAVDSVSVLVDSAAGADGTAFKANVVLLSVSDCTVKSGCPVAVNSKL